MIKVFVFFKKLLIPLYLFFFLSMFVSGFLAAFFENYSFMPFAEISELIHQNRNKFQLLFDIEIEREESPENQQTEKELEEEIKKRFGGTRYVGMDETLFHKYWLYRTRHPVFILFLFLLIWLWPVYKHIFENRVTVSPTVQNRVMNLPLVLFLLPWLSGSWGLFLKLYYRWVEGYEIGGAVLATYIGSFLMYGSLAGFFNAWYTTRYVNNGVSRQVFKGEQLYSLKGGFSLDLTTRILLLVVSLGIIPLILSVYIPSAFNWWLFKALINHESVDVIEVGRIAGPIILTAIVNLFFLLSLLGAVFTFRKNIQGPLNLLIERMKKVEKGDFSTRTTVLSSDEIGNLKGHFNIMVEGLEEREHLRDTFGKFVSMEIARKLIETKEIDLKGEEIETTVMFADIRNFTSMSEGYAPRKLIEFLNDYFSYMVQPISEQQGVVNKFIGDCIMAVFSPVFGLDDHAEAAVRASLAMRDALDKFNGIGKYPQIHHGIGIHTGMLIAGNVGSEDRKEYTVIGDTVNVASRIESQTKVYNTDILISESTYRLLEKGFLRTVSSQKMEPVIVRGKSQPITLYSLG